MSEFAEVRNVVDEARLNEMDRQGLLRGLYFAVPLGLAGWGIVWRLFLLAMRGW